MVAILPNPPVDGQIAIDFSGTRFQYSAEFNQWIDIGGSVDSQIVNYKQNGLITPEITGVLEDARSEEIIDFKFVDNAEAYYYMLQPLTNNRLFLFTIENNDIRIELNRSSLTNLLNNSACQGAKGKRGATGDDGVDGLAGPVEPTFVAQIDNNKLSISDIKIETPLDTDISMRIINIDGGEIEIWLNIDTGDSEIKKSSETIVSTDLQYENGLFSASVVIDGEWGDDWSVKVRQRGPKGINGSDGEPFITVTESSLYALKATEFITSLRRAQNDNIFYIRQDLIDIPSIRLRPYGGLQVQDGCTSFAIVLSGEVSNSDKLAALEPSIDTSKGIRRWLFDQSITTSIVLNLPVWVPDPSCSSQVDFGWWQEFEGTPQEVQADIRQAPALPEQCCQEDFFFCPNLSTGCAVSPDGPWHPTPPVPPTGTM